MNYLAEPFTPLQQCFISSFIHNKTGTCGYSINGQEAHMEKQKQGFLPKFKTFSIGFFLIVGILFSIIAVINLNLPTESPVIDHLSSVEQNRMMEVVHLKKTLGNEVWPGWGDHDSPILIYNEEYAFLLGMDEPSPGWIRVPYKTPEGRDWEQVPGDFTYHRQPLPETGETPQAFIVEIGNQFAASMTTKDWTQISLMKLIKNDLPNFLKPIMPYSLFINKFNSDWHVTGILHESFHAYQASEAYERVKSAENVTAFHHSYPWNNLEFREMWLHERQLLAKAMMEKNTKELRPLVREWLSIRKERRAFLDTKLINYEKQREWLEGLAKYAELQSWLLAANSPAYSPLSEMENDPDFNFYRDAKNQRNQEIRQLQSDLQFSETIFYYSGWAQAVILDRLYPEWKSKAFEPGVYLDELLEEICIPISCPVI